MVEVAVAARNLVAGEPISNESLSKKIIPRSAAPSKAILWNQTSMLLNLKIKTAISRGDYIVYDDIGDGRGLSAMVGDGEWAVSISLNGGAITSRLRPGDEIAIMGTFELKEKTPSTIVGQDGKESRRRITTVILPQVRILALDGNLQQGGDQFVLALPPKNAQVLLAAQEQGISLSPALRKPHDETNLNRTTTGFVDGDTFNNLAQGVERTLIPVVPSKK
ncbi:MAG: Flp pilus assembly protein CpaB, partial [Victivallaceae bacterium]